MKRITMLAFAVLAACGDPVAPRSAPGSISPSIVMSDVTITDLGTLGGPYSNARAVNEAGQVVGTSSTTEPGVVRAFIWEASTGMRALPHLPSAPPCGYQSYAMDINDLGQVVGVSVRDCISHPVLWEPGSSSPIEIGDGSLSQGVAAAINNLGQIAGTLTTFGHAPSAFVWTQGRGVRQLLGDNMTSSQALDINDHGEVIGIYHDREGAGQRAFHWSERGGFTDLGALDHEQVFPTAINDLGIVVGVSSSPFMWSASSGMGRLPIGFAYASDINDQMQVAGSDEYGPFVWTESFGTSALLRLPMLPGSNTAWMDVKLNEQGMAVGASGDPSRPRAVLWRFPRPAVVDAGAQLAALADQVRAARSAGSGIIRGLAAKVEAAQRQLSSGNHDGARHLLEAFIAQVQALAGAGQIESAEALALINGASGVIAAL